MSQTREFNSTPIPTADLAFDEPWLEFHILTFFSFRELSLAMATSNAWREMANAVRIKLENSPTLQQEFTFALLYFIQQRNYEKINYYLHLGLQYNVNLNVPYVGKRFEGVTTVKDGTTCLFQDPSPLLLASNQLSYHQGAKIVQSLLYKPGLDLFLYSIQDAGELIELKTDDDSIFFYYNKEKRVIADKNQIIKCQNLNTPLLIRYNDRFSIYRYVHAHRSWRLFTFTIDADKENISEFNQLPFKENEVTHAVDIKFTHTLCYLLYRFTYVGIEDTPVAFMITGFFGNITSERKIAPWLHCYDTQIYAVLQLARFESFLINIRSHPQNYDLTETRLANQLISQLEYVGEFDNVLLRNYLTRLLQMDDSIRGITRPLTREDLEILNALPNFQSFTDNSLAPSFYRKNIKPYRLHIAYFLVSGFFLSACVGFLFISLPFSILWTVISKGIAGLIALGSVAFIGATCTDIHLLNSPDLLHQSVSIKSNGEFRRDIYLKNSPDHLHQKEDKRVEKQTPFRGGLFFKQPKTEISLNPQNEVSLSLVPYSPTLNLHSPKLN